LTDPSISGAAILNWAVQGALKWQRDGLRIPARVIAATEQYRAEQDQVGEFIEDTCFMNSAASVPVTALRAEYEAWCQKNGCRPLGRHNFLEALKGRGIEPSRTTGGRRVFRGIGLLHREAEED
jgi:putative DNA primase/helicase